MNVYEVTLKSLHYKHDISNTIFSLLNKVTHFIKKNLALLTVYIRWNFKETSIWQKGIDSVPLLQAVPILTVVTSLKMGTFASQYQTIGLVRIV